MHPSSWIAAHLFLLYLHEKLALFCPANSPSTDPGGSRTDGAVRILDFGSSDVSGNMKDALAEALASPLARPCSARVDYTGLDASPGPNVDTTRFDPVWASNASY